MSKITINLDEDEKKILQHRAKRNLLTLCEQIEDIVRRSCVSYSGGKGKSRFKVDDKLVAVFSRERRGRKKKAKKKIKK